MGQKTLFILLAIICLAFSGWCRAENLAFGPPLRGAWSTPKMSGQGFFVEVYQQPPRLFIGWFSFPRPAEGKSADPVAHRWYTIEGLYSGSDIVADIYQTTGGNFAAVGAVEQVVIGSAIVSFSDCNHGLIEYQFDGAEQGSLPIRRIVSVPEYECESLIEPESVPDSISRQEAAVFDHVTVLQMPEGNWAEQQMVVVQDGLITYVGEQADELAPQDATHIDGRSRFLIPGLVDAHVHLAAHAPGLIRSTIAPNELFQLTANGVTTILVPGNNFSAQKYIQQVADGSIYGPAIYDSRWVFTPEEGGNRMPATAAEARTFVQDAKSDGYRFIKFFDHVSPEVTFALIDEAHKQAMPTIAHFQTTVPPVEVMDAGLDLVAHIQEFGIDYFSGQTDAALIPQAISDTLRNGTSVTSTLVIDEFTAQVAGGDPEGIAAYHQRPELRWFIPQSIEANEQRILVLANQWPEPGSYDEELEFLRKLTRELHQAGVPIVLGTDSPSSGAVPGFAVHREIQALLNCGLPAKDVIRIATWNGAQFIYQSLNLATPIGAIRPDWKADLVLLDSNPLVSADNLTDIAGVMTQGRWLSGELLAQGLEDIAVSYGN